MTAIVAYDTQFYEHLPSIFPHNPTVISWFKGEGKEEVAPRPPSATARLQGAYLIIAARSLGSISAR